MVTAWPTHTVGFGSFGLLKDTATGSLSTGMVVDVAPTIPAAFVAFSWIGM